MRILIVSQPGGGSILSAALSPNGSQGVFLSLGEELFTFDLATATVRDSGLRGRWPVRYSADGKHIALISEGRLGLVMLEGKPRLKQIMDLEGPRHIRPIEGGFLVACGDGSFRMGGRYTPAKDRVEMLWKLTTPAGNSVLQNTDFDPVALLGVCTDFRFVTSVIDLGTGTVRLSIDNSANYPSTLVGWSSAGSYILWLLGGGLILVLLALVRRRRTDPATPPPSASRME